MMLIRRSWIKMSHNGILLLPGCGALSFSTDTFLNNMSMVLGNISAHPSLSRGQASSSSSSSHSHSPFSHSPLSPFSHVRSYSASLEGSSSPSGGGGGNGGASSSSDVSSEEEEDSSSSSSSSSNDPLSAALPVRANYTTQRRAGYAGGKFIAPVMQVLRLTDEQGKPVEDSGEDVLDGSVFPDANTAVKLYKTMARLQVMDAIFYEAQRQARFSFYMTSAGEEATVVASAAALHDEDVIYAQYREQGALMWRGYTCQDFADQCYSNERDPNKGRQMPIHYGDKHKNFVTISSPLGTQLPQAVGHAYALRMEDDGLVASRRLDVSDDAAGEQHRRVVACYFGEGAASEGDFHAALNMSATLDTPVVFLCRNNGWAISTPAWPEQYKGDGIAGRGGSYGVRSIRVDGNDAVAVYVAVSQARAEAAETGTPRLLELMTYRRGHHSTSDDSTRYRGKASEIAREPVGRFAAYLKGLGWWSDDEDAEWRAECRAEAIDALREGESVSKPPISGLFEDVYKDMPWNISRQLDETLAHAKRFPEEVPHGVPLH
ncbi:2-oxoisovalerate dehydrogenase E1 component subunit alpha [Pseudoscourfieldia marina]